MVDQSIVNEAKKLKSELKIYGLTPADYLAGVAKLNIRETYIKLEELEKEIKDIKFRLNNF